MEEVVIKDIRMDFLLMVVFMVKWVLASIPAMIVLFSMGVIFSSLFTIFIN